MVMENELQHRIKDLVKYQNNVLSSESLDRKDSSGFTELMSASMSRDETTIELLLRHGADPDIENDNGETALMLAIENADYRSVKILSLYANLNYANKYGDTALSHAKYWGNQLVEDFLLLEGATDSGRKTHMEIMDDELRLEHLDLSQVFPDPCQCSPIWSHSMFTVMEPPYDRHNGATGCSP